MLDRIFNIIRERIVQQWQSKGHSLTGAFEESIRYEVQEGERTEMFVIGRDYGVYMSVGAQPENVPYTRGSRGQGKGGTSKYITGLQEYAKTRLGLDDREALSVAFAIAETHKKTGFPFRNGEVGTRFLEISEQMFLQDLKKEVLKYVKSNIYGNNSN
jgi:hypothetical protein